MKKYLYLIIIILIVAITVITTYFLVNRKEKSDIAEENIINDASEMVATIAKEESNIEEIEETEEDNNKTEEITVTVASNDSTPVHTNAPVDTTTKVNSESKQNTTEKISTNKTQEKKQSVSTSTSTEQKQSATKDAVVTTVKQEQTTVKAPTNVEQTKTEVSTNKTQEQKNETPTTTTQTIVKLDFSKYDRYSPGLNGGYKCFKKNPTEIAKLKGLLQDAIKEFGYTNVKLVEDSSIDKSRYFTANKTNTQNVVYNTEGCAIHYYAETEYTLSKDGQESIIQLRSYTKIKGQ